MAKVKRVVLANKVYFSLGLANALWNQGVKMSETVLGKVGYQKVRLVAEVLDENK